MFALRRVSVTVMVIDSIIPPGYRVSLFSEDTTVAMLNGFLPCFSAGFICANFCIYVL